MDLECRSDKIVNTRWFRWLEITIGMMCCLYIWSPLCFIESVIPGQSEKLIGSIYLLSIWLILICLKKWCASDKIRFKVALPDLLILLYVIYLILSNLTIWAILDREIVLNHMAVLLLYITIRNTPGAVFKYYIGLLPIIVLWQLYYGVAEQTDYFMPGKSFQQLCGSFLNTGIWSGFVAMIIVTGIGLIYCMENRIGKIMGVLFVLLLGILLFAGYSRAAWLSVLTGSVFFFYCMLKTHLRHRNKWVVGVVLLFLFCWLLCFLYYIKVDSAHGRLLIWRITYGMWLEYPVVGWGIDGFRQHYMDFQGLYFKEGQSVAMGLLAGENPFAFSEVFRMVVEQGMIGLALTVMLLYVVLFSKQSRHSGLYIVVQSVIVAFVVFSLFSYPLAVFQLRAVLIFMLAVAVRFYDPLYQFRLSKVGAVSSCFLLLFFCYAFVGPYQKAFVKWNETLKSDTTFSSSEIKLIDSVCRPLANTPFFLTNYTMLLNRSGHTESALSIAEKTVRQYPSYVSYIELGKSYRAAGRDDKAESAWITAGFMVPHKFTPLYLRAKMHYENGEIEKARDLATMILQKEVKVYTPELFLIQNEMRTVCGIVL